MVTDAHRSFEGLNHLKGHSIVNHSEGYVRGMVFHMNFAESYHGLLKRGIVVHFIMLVKSTFSETLPSLIGIGIRANRATENVPSMFVGTAIEKRLNYSDMIG